VTAPRTVAVPTRDHGPVETVCPAWCAQQYHQANGYRVDITHASTDTELTLPTSAGPAVVLRLVFEQRPYTQLPPGRDVFVNVEIDGDWYPMGPHGLDAIADALVENATEIRSAARRLTSFLAKERG
jgi:hypothetical protein